MRALAAALVLTLVLSGSALDAQDLEPGLGRGATLVDELEAKIAKLEAVVEGTAQPVNLARTSLATVTASSVNGSRSLANGFYGIRNAFDDGRNVINGIHYTYWLSSGEPSPWAEVRFDVPVTIASIFVEGGADYTARLIYVKGGERDFGPSGSLLDLPQLQHGVSAVRLTFRAAGNHRVDEIRVMGHARPGTVCEERAPRLLLDRHHALLAAKEALQEWRARQLSGLAEHTVEETEQAIVVTFLLAEVPVLRVTFDRATSEAKTEALARWVPIATGEVK